MININPLVDCHHYLSSAILVACVLLNQLKTNVMKAQKVMPNMVDYAHFTKNFSWDKVRAELDGLPENGGLNIAYEAVVRHAKGINKDHVAIKWLGVKGEEFDFTYKKLDDESNRFANVLSKLNIKRGENIFVMLGRIPQLYIAALGTWKKRGTFCPLFSAFGPEPILQRMSKGKAKILITTEKLYKKKIEGIINDLTGIHYILLVDAWEHINKKVRSLPLLMSEVSDKFEIKETNPDDIAILHFTSGTTGTPKGALHVHNAILTHYSTGKYVLDIHPNDIYWCTADPGWVTGTSYGIIAPLVLGTTMIVVEADFDSERWFTILEKYKVNVWYTSPTAIRMLMRANIKSSNYDLSALRNIHSVGEPLNPEAIYWSEKELGQPIYDNWWQTETGGIMISNFASMKIKPGSMGKPIPGIEAAILKRDEKRPIFQDAGEIGDLALKKGWPSEFRGYLHEKKRYTKCFVDQWYITGDLAKMDEDGYFWFVGRADDIIKTSGHMVGPFEVESTLMEHPDVAEAAVFGLPDPVIGAIVVAYVLPKIGVEPSEELGLNIKGFAREKLGSAVAPKIIKFKTDLPRTRSGKIMRRLLQSLEMGTPLGDTSTLEKAGNES